MSDVFRAPEVLSPAGNLEKLKTAVAYGADAVYMSGKNFGLRTFSDNFTHDEMREGVEYAHSHGVKCYCTVNVMAHEDDIGKLDDEILFLSEIGMDALIISDAGIFRKVRKLAPDMEIHISTQASVTNSEGCMFWYELGAKRVVLARELTLEEIIKIRKAIPSDLELECFVHGAMCVSYSGRCLLSNYFTGRSANSGSCAQPCRWGYYVVEEKRLEAPLPIQEDERGTYIFNSKDICMIGHIPELIRAGITSFKIEGRIKGAFYAASVTKAYREAVDLYMKDPDAYREDEKWQQMLDRTVHREFATGFFYDKPGENAQIFPDKTYHRPAFVVGVVTGYDEEKGCAIISQRNKIFKGDTLHVLTPDGYPDPIIAEEIFDENGDPIESTPHAEMTYLLKVKKPLAAYSFLSRDGDKDEGIYKSGEQPAQTKP